MSHRISLTLTIPLLCSLSLQACGDEEPENTGTTGADATDTSTSTSTGDGDGDGDPPPDPNCGCADDEVCVAHADDFCGAGFGYSITCEPIADCEGSCSCEQMCGDFCVPACEYNSGLGVDFWCGGFPGPDDCDIFAQDCPEGEKCVPYSSMAQGYDDNKCVSIMGDAAPGEPCFSGGLSDATDNCNADGYCLFTNDESVCQPFCTPQAECETPGLSCATFNNETIAMCLADCDPFAIDPCPEWASCMPGGAGTEEPFICFPGPTPDRVQGDSCNYLNDCAPGLVCADASDIEGCRSNFCCTALCHFDDQAACEGLEPMMCLTYFDPGPPPAGFEQVGMCKLP